MTERNLFVIVIVDEKHTATVTATRQCVRDAGTLHAVVLWTEQIPILCPWQCYQH